MIEEEEFQFYENDPIIRSVGDAKEAVIPAVMNGKRISSIGEDSFAGIGLTGAVIPEGILSIGKGAFADNELTSVVIPESVTKIGTSAFENNELTSVDIPEGVTKIGEKAFSENKLTSVVIPEDVTEIWSGAFADNALTSVVIPSDVTLEDDAIDTDFAAFYNGNGKKAGTYTLADGQWTYAAR